MKARIIPANKRTISNRKLIRQKALRVAAYCRVSTDREEQESSYQIQCRHYESMILKHPGWELAGIYADEGITALTTRKREQFNRMISDCEEGRIDLIITKSISRFARNTIDCLNHIRELKTRGIAVIFEKESINTMDAQGELLITILASIAQQESESISRNVQMGVRSHYQEGRICAGHQNILGYLRDEDGKLQVIPEEAAIVRRIYRYYLDGYSPGHIGEILKKEELIDSRGHQRRWNTSSIRYILSNEKYMGDLLLQKYYTVDFLSKKVSPNRGEVDKYYVENSHDPIIPKDIFFQVQAEAHRRKKARQAVRYLHSRGLSGRVYCAECGSPYYRKAGGYKEQARFRCATKLKEEYRHIPCLNTSIREEDLMEIVVRAFNLLPGEREHLIRLGECINCDAIEPVDRYVEFLGRTISCIDKTDCQTDSQLTPKEAEIEQQLYEANQQRAVYTSRAIHVMNLLHRIDYLLERADKKGKTGSHIFRKCRNAEEFLLLTDREYPQGLVGEYKDEEVIQFIDRIVIGEDAVVCFKAGIEVRVSRASSGLVQDY